MTDYSPYYNQMAEIDGKVAVFEAAKLSLNNIKTEYQGALDDLNRSKDKFSSDVPNITEADVFEGDLANAVASKIAVFKGLISTASGNASAVITEIDGLIAAIDGQITALGDLKTQVNNNLNAAIDAVNAASR